MIREHPSMRIAALLVIASLAGCGQKDEPAADDAAPTNEIDAVETPTADEPAPADDADETLEVVEESAADTAATDDDEEIILARADVPSVVNVSYQFEEGRHYSRLVPSQPTIGGADRIEVAEFFWYGCPHCYDLEPTINSWAEDIPPTVRFVRVPAMWNEVLQLHARLYYTEEVLVRNGIIKDAEGFRKAVFEEYHRRGNRLLSVESIRRLFNRFGVSDTDFDRTWNSFEVAQKLHVAADLARRYSIMSVPAVVVNGKYRTSGSEAGSYPKLIEVIDELIARESAR
ncbi:MAG: DsbA family protein [Woeseiaceae bacterium]|nr:DsbA family protein [Woeseiaceae bacterium]